MTDNHPLPKNFRVELSQVTPIARGVRRPECVLSLDDGSLLASNGGGGYSVIGADGTCRHVLATNVPEGISYLPNGIALTPAGDVYFAHLGVETGGVFSIAADGSVKPVVTEMDNRPLPPTNYVTVTDSGQTWFSVSTSLTPRSKAWNKKVADGFIAVKDERGVRVVADGLGYTNEIAFSPDGRWVYANETYAQRVSRFALKADGSLGARETVAEFGGADLPDGIVFDAHGGLWISCIASNRVILVRPSGEQQVIIENSDPAFMRRIAEGIAAANLVWTDMQGPPGQSQLGNTSSFAFGPKGSGFGYIGNLTSDCIWRVSVPIDGVQVLHFGRRLSTSPRNNVGPIDLA